MNDFSPFSDLIKVAEEVESRDVMLYFEVFDDALAETV